ncbi:hypothetical protein OC846_006102 [Tilletia horrida]|uniref:Chromo domain-containing protein n=1 Tax=Tilletia horrida TaxID=155126 RepID=A0AAN6JR03_9BASI|nr:hypothetical protein OC845_006000 [Tilletia horrida]KAK0544370.1 hypothetical protein OC846_006102 [Tilletia horrida]
MSDQENDAGSDEEYEIEQVLDCDYERFEQGKWAYLVSWKGYGPDDNSWVREEDAENAQEMLDEFWEHNSSKREAVERAIAAKKAKAAASKKRSRASGSRGSMERDVSSSQKRARQGSSSRDQRAIEVDDFDDEEDEAAATAAAQREDPIARKKKKDMEAKRRLAAVGDWDPLVERVETVERNESGELVVFLTFNTGEQLAYQSDVCRTRCPQALIKFYEQHLRFRDSSGSNAAAAAKDADVGAVMVAAAAAAKEEEEKKKNGGSGAIEVVDDDDDIVMTGSGQQHQ